MPLSLVFLICSETKSLELSKLQQLSEKALKIEEYAKHREEAEEVFAKQTEKELQLKMEKNKENKEALFNQLMERLRKTVSGLCQKRRSIHFN